MPKKDPKKTPKREKNLARRAFPVEKKSTRKSRKNKKDLSCSASFPRGKDKQYCRISRKKY